MDLKEEKKQPRHSKLLRERRWDMPQRTKNEANPQLRKVLRACKSSDAVIEDTIMAYLRRSKPCAHRSKLELNNGSGRQKTQ